MGLRLDLAGASCWPNTGWHSLCCAPPIVDRPPFVPCPPSPPSPPCYHSLRGHLPDLPGGHGFPLVRHPHHPHAVHAAGGHHGGHGAAGHTAQRR